MTVIGGTSLTLTGGAGPEVVISMVVDSQFFTLTGATPELGHLFPPDAYPRTDAPSRAVAASVRFRVSGCYRRVNHMPSVRSVLLVAIAFMCAAPIHSSATAAQIERTESATEFYMRWRSTVLSAKSVDELASFLDADTLEQFEMEPEPAKSDTLPMMKRVYQQQNDVKVVKETTTPYGATLSLEALDSEKKPLAGTVDVVKENGAWKMTNAVERWKPKE